MILKIIKDTKKKTKKKLTLCFSMSSMMDAHNFVKKFILVIIAQFETISNLDISFSLFDECINNICG
jgi:hypothetical protein